MKKKKSASNKNLFDRFATTVTKATGTTPVFISAFGIVVIWAIAGPFFDYSETWQLVINTGTTIITFLMVFLIQKTQNKDSLAIQLKLNELVASSRFASNRLVDIEDLSEEEMEVLKKYYMKLSDLSEEESSLIISHSIDEAQENHAVKSKKSAKPKKNILTKSTADKAVKVADAKPRPKRRKPRAKKDDPGAEPKSGS